MSKIRMLRNIRYKFTSRRSLLSSWLRDIRYMEAAMTEPSKNPERKIKMTITETLDKIATITSTTTSTPSTPLIRTGLKVQSFASTHPKIKSYVRRFAAPSTATSTRRFSSVKADYTIYSVTAGSRGRAHSAAPDRGTGARPTEK